jgi:hypothetical protein
MLDLEAQLINHLAIPMSVEFLVRDGFSVDLIERPQAKKAYQFTVSHYRNTQTPPTLEVLKTEFPEEDFEETDTPIEWLTDKLRNRFQKKRVETLVEDVAKRHDQPDEAMRFLREQVLEIDRASLSTREIWTPESYPVFLEDWKDQIITGMHKGSSFGFKDIDDFTGGLKKGQVGYVMARMKRKKTWYWLKAFIEHVKANEEPYLNTLELTSNEIRMRLSCMLSGVSWNDAQRGKLMPQDWKRIDQAWKEFSKYKFWIEQPSLDERTVPHLLQKADKVDAGSIFISQFHYIQGTKDFYRNKHEEHAEVAVSLKQAAIMPGKERPIFIEAQFNRGGDTMEELDDFTGSKVGLTDMIPQSADIMFGIVETKDLRLNQMAEYGILDSRYTDKASWHVRYEFIKSTMIDLAPGSQH